MAEKKPPHALDSLHQRLIQNALVCESAWHLTVNQFLTKALAHMGTLQNATHAKIQDYLDTVADSCSAAARNRAAASLSGFYKWLRDTGYVPQTHNPMAKIKQLREERPPDGVVIWEENEVPELLRKVRGRKDGISIWIGILAGLRRGEIARLDWRNVTPSYLIVEKSKTGKKRHAPMSATLYAELEKFRENPLSYGVRLENMTKKGASGFRRDGPKEIQAAPGNSEVHFLSAFHITIL